MMKPLINYERLFIMEAFSREDLENIMSGGHYLSSTHDFRKILKNPQIEKLTKDINSEFEKLRKLLFGMNLKTDIKVHPDFISKYPPLTPTSNPLACTTNLSQGNTGGLSNYSPLIFNYPTPIENSISKILQMGEGLKAVLNNSDAFANISKSNGWIENYQSYNFLKLNKLNLNATPKTDSSGIIRLHFAQGIPEILKGVGSLVYEGFIHTIGHGYSDSGASEKARPVWNKMLESPSIIGFLAPLISEKVLCMTTKLTKDQCIAILDAFIRKVSNNREVKSYREFILFYHDKGINIKTGEKIDKELFALTKDYIKDCIDNRASYTPAVPTVEFDFDKIKNYRNGDREELKIMIERTLLNPTFDFNDLYGASNVKDYLTMFKDNIKEEYRNLYKLNLESYLNMRYILTLSNIEFNRFKRQTRSKLVASLIGGNYSIFKIRNGGDNILDISSNLVGNFIYGDDNLYKADILTTDVKTYSTGSLIHFRVWKNSETNYRIDLGGIGATDNNIEDHKIKIKNRTGEEATKFKEFFTNLNKVLTSIIGMKTLLKYNTNEGEKTYSELIQSIGSASPSSTTTSRNVNISVSLAAKEWLKHYTGNSNLTDAVVLFNNQYPDFQINGNEERRLFSNFRIFLNTRPDLNGTNILLSNTLTLTEFLDAIRELVTDSNEPRENLRPRERVPSSVRRPRERVGNRPSIQVWLLDKYGTESPSVVIERLNRTFSEVLTRGRSRNRNLRYLYDEYKSFMRTNHPSVTPISSGAFANGIESIMRGAARGFTR